MDYKEALLNSGLFKSVTSSPFQYRCQHCPFCGDSKWHLYVLIKTIDDTPVLYNCKKCNASGILNRHFLEYFHLDDITLPKNVRHKKLVTNDSASVKVLGDFVNEDDDIDEVCRYIDRRVGVKCDVSDLKAFQYIANPLDYTKEYLNYHGNEKYFNGRCWFKLTNGNIIGRWMEGDHQIRWLRFKGLQNMKGGLYSIKKPIDVYRPIQICIVEGIMDAIGLYYHGGLDNAVYVACMGSDYMRGLTHVLHMGIFGDTVSVGIYKDSDVENQYIRMDKQMCQLFKRVDIYQNLLDKDYGVDKDHMEIHKVGNFK